MNYTFKILATLPLALVLGLQFANGQRAYTAPAAFLPTEPIKVIVSVYGTPLEDNAGPMNMWLAANDDEPINAGVAVKERDNFWSFSISPSANEYFSTTISKIKGIVKTSDGTLATGIFEVTPFDFTTASAMLTVVPVKPYFSENVSLIFDRTKSDRDDLSTSAPIYMWAWNNTDGLGDAPNQGGWQSISSSAVMTEVPGFPNLWRKDIVPQTYWATTKTMTDFGCLFRNMASDKQTNDLTVLLFKAPGLVEKPKKVKNFPMSFTKLDVVTIIYDQKLEENPILKAADAIYITTTIFSETYRPQPNPISLWTQDWTANAETPAIQRLKMIPYGNPTDSIYRITYVPLSFYSYYSSISSILNITKLFVTFRNLEGTGISQKEEIKIEKPD